MPTAAQVKALSPTGEFAAYTDAFVDDLIVNEVAGHYGSVAEPPLDRLIALHAAHLLALMNAAGGGGNGNGPAGPLTGVSISVGGASKQWARCRARTPARAGATWTGGPCTAAERPALVVPGLRPASPPWWLVGPLRRALLGALGVGGERVEVRDAAVTYLVGAVTNPALVAARALTLDGSPTERWLGALRAVTVPLALLDPVRELRVSDRGRARFSGGTIYTLSVFRWAPSSAASVGQSIEYRRCLVVFRHWIIRIFLA